MKYTGTNTNHQVEYAYKDVVIIGNGPSGICLSYMLSGNWPHWNPQDIINHPDELLRARLSCADSNKSLVEQDLLELAEGLEGRSTNPVSLLLDSLQNPCADIGLEMPSLLRYQYQPDKEISHVVLGSGPPGGSWHRMDPNLRTLSLSAWMSLPGLDYHTSEPLATQELDASDGNRTTFESTHTNSKPKCDNKSNGNTWWRCFSTLNNRNTNNNLTCEKIDTKSGPRDMEIRMYNEKHFSAQLLKTPVPRRVLSVRRQVSREVQTRALVSDVAQYYEDYVKMMNLERHFRNNTLVTCVKPNTNTNNKHIRWQVRGIHANGTHFAYSCRNVVLANGASDLANRLGISGEGSNEWVKHDLPALVTMLEEIPDTERSKLKPVLVVGAGLSAADAVTICRSSGIGVIHVYRSRSAGLDKMLPETVYPEYHEDSVNTYSLYSPMPEHTIIEIISGSTDATAPCHQVVLKHLNTGDIKTVDVSFCAILIGFRPDLHFLDPNIRHDDIKVPDNDVCNEGVYFTRENHLLASPYALISRKLAWLKNLCAKCKHLGVCERNRKKNGQAEKKTTTNNFVVVTEPKATSPQGLGEDPTKPIDCKSNPMAVDKYSNEVLNIPMKGLYAMGPLVGDNFIRFIPGGALAITSALWKQR